MKAALLGLALITLAPVAHAQIIIQPPVVVAPGPRGPYWRGERDDWRARAEFREAEHRRHEWRRDHCVRDYRGQEFCRR